MACQFGPYMEEEVPSSTAGVLGPTTRAHARLFTLVLALVSEACFQNVSRGLWQPARAGTVGTEKKAMGLARGTLHESARHSLSHAAPLRMRMHKSMRPRGPAAQAYQYYIG